MYKFKAKDLVRLAHPTKRTLDGDLTEIKQTVGVVTETDYSFAKLIQVDFVYKGKKITGVFYSWQLELIKEG